MAIHKNIVPPNKWAKKEEKRKDPNYWLEELRPQIMERIKHYENFLEKWGITAQTGIEQEFYITTKDKSIRPDIKTLPYQTDKTIYFKNSPFVEQMVREHSWHNGFEISLGKGNGKNEKAYPHDSLKPNAMVRAAEKANKLVSIKASNPKNRYKTTGISFDPTEQGERMWSQQVNISLWDNQNKKPLLQDACDNGSYHPNDLSKLCTKNLLETQKALIAAFTVNPNSFHRFRASEWFYNKKQKSIKFAFEKQENPSVILRDHSNEGEKYYYYIENRLGNSDMPPSINMLITLAGIAEGVKEYVNINDIKTPEELHQKLENDNSVSFIPFPHYNLPQTQEIAIKTTENSALAQKILGKDLHKKFVGEYKKECLSHNNNSSISL